MAIVKALRITPKGDVLTVILDSMYAIQGILENLRKWEDKCWMRGHNAAIYQKITYGLATMRGETYFQWLKDHSKTPINDGGDQKATQGHKRKMLTAESA